MCTRFSFNLMEENLGFLGLGSVSFQHQSLQVTPGRQVWMIRNTNQSKPELVQAKWGLAPSWLDDFSKVQVNARVETASRLPMFKEAWAKRRCLVLADSYYQWHSSIDQRRQLWQISRQESPFILMAGLWEQYLVDKTLSFDSCAILTMPSVEQLSLISERMPVVLNNEDALSWLNGSHYDVSQFLNKLHKYSFASHSLVKR
ncbi:MAG: SOS response-associated peptidase [Endozoicomonas sp.]